MKAGEFMMNAIWIPSYYSMVKFKFIIIIIKVYFDQVSLNTQFTVSFSGITGIDFPLNLGVFNN